MGPHLYKVQIEDQDIDPIYGVVGWDAPRRWYREAHEDLFRSRGLDLATLRMHGCLFVPSRDETRWTGSPIFRSDEPIVETVLSIRDLVNIREGKYSEMRFDQKIKVNDSMKVVSGLILIYSQGRRKTSLPAYIRSRLEG